MSKEGILSFEILRFNILETSTCEVSYEVLGFRSDAVKMKNYLDVEDLEVYKKLCRLHIEVCDLAHAWPQEEKYELEARQGALRTAHLPSWPRKMTTGISATRSKV
jgi:hypothetical protein